MLPYFQFHHIGIACPDIDKTASVYTNAGYSRTETVIDPLQNVYVSVLSKDGMPTIELLSPVDETSPICKTIEKAGGVSIYHTCYIVPDINQAIVELRAQKYMPTTKVKYSNVFDRDVYFLYHRNIGLIEIIQK